MANTIPKKLFPVIDNDFNENWARRTYPYAHMFTQGVDALIPSDLCVNNWRNRALQIGLELSNIGKEAGKEQVLNVAKCLYNLKMPGTDISPNCIRDVLRIVGDKQWYNDNKNSRINQIYMMVYGILR